MDLVLKQFDDILLHFTAERTIDGIDVTITSTNKDKATYLPLGMKPTNESLTRWLRHRTIPANRAYAQNFLSKNGLSENDFIGILQICKGLSLTDCYWVTYPDDPKTFAQLTPPTIEIVGFLGGAARFIAKPCLKQRVMRFPIIRYRRSA